MVKPDTLARIAGNIAAGMAGNLSQPDITELTDVVRTSVRLAVMIAEQLEREGLDRAGQPTTEN